MNILEIFEKFPTQKDYIEYGYHSHNVFAAYWRPSPWLQGNPIARLPAVCFVYPEARIAGVLYSSQFHLADIAEGCRP